MTRTTHFGFKTVSETEKAREVAGVFDAVAERYNLMNDLMSGGMHRLWKRFAVEVSGVRTGDRVLDIAGGTADLSSLFLEQVGSRGEVWLTDMSRRLARQVDDPTERLTILKNVHRHATRVRNEVYRVAIEPSVLWIDVQARADVLNFIDQKRAEGFGIDVKLLLFMNF